MTIRFRSIKGILLLYIMLLVSPVLHAESILPYDSVTGKIAYKFTLELDKSYKAESIFEMVEYWFMQNPTQFTRCNLADSQQVIDTKKNINRDLVHQEFANKLPLHSIDPASNRLTGKVITKYCRTQNSCMRLFYVEYFLVINIQDNRIFCEVSDIRYNHFNPKSYQLQRIYNWASTSNSCDPINTLEYLRSCESSHQEFDGFASYLNTDIIELVYSLRNFISPTKVLPFISYQN